MSKSTYYFLKHNQNKCVFGENIYVKEAIYKNFTTLRCCIRKCHGKLHIFFSTRVAEEVDFHNSEDHHKPYIKALIREKIFKLATTTDYQPVQIFDQLNKVFSQQEMNLFSKKTLYMQIYKYRGKQLLYSGNYDIPIEYTKTLQHDNFLLFDSGMDDEKRYVIFGTLENLNNLKSAFILHADGTFKIAPKPFMQVYILYYRLEQKIFPAVYCYLAKKDEEIYLRLFKKLKELSSDFKAQYLIVDMEIAAINAFRKCFPSVHIFICLFHLGQAWWRNIQANGLSKDYTDVRGTRKLIRQIVSLAFVPEKDVKKCYDLLFSYVSELNDQRLLNFYRYFGKYYVEDGSIIPIKMWNSYNRVLNNIPLTNNQVEAFNNNLNFRIYSNSVSFVDSLKIIITMQNEKEMLLDNTLLNSNNVFYDEKMNKMQDILKSYEDMPILLYLSSIGLIYSFKFNKK